ncbi:MAG: M23 family metallopeptidase [Campylobacterota bacterium]|nr:M23 family metallopeptidase [Campylobacterota bacterium]
MKKIILFLTLFYSYSISSVKDIDTKINQNKKQYSTTLYEKNNINKNMEVLAKKINDEEKLYKNIIKVLDTTNNKLILNGLKLRNAKEKLKKLNKLSKKLSLKKDKIQKDVIAFVIENYAMTMGTEQVKKQSLDDIVSKELYMLVLENVKQEILNLNVEYLKINKEIRENEKSITKISKYIEKQDLIQKKYQELELKHENTIESLNKKHKIYQKNLQIVINKQNQITDLLGSLDILKKKEIRAEELRIKKAKALAKKRKRDAQLKRKKELEIEKKRKLKASKNKILQNEAKKKKTKDLKIAKRKELDNDINIEVKKIGSSAKGVKISKYSGRKTIAPLKSYQVVKKFGKYYDKVYKMELFNESASLKTKKPNAKVFSVFKGQVVYAKQNSGLLENVVIVKHANNLHTIYSHLDKISPTLKAGKWIPKGYVVGRVNDILHFQATKNSKYIDPLKLVK